MHEDDEESQVAKKPRKGSLRDEEYKDSEFGHREKRSRRTPPVARERIDGESRAKRRRKDDDDEPTLDDSDDDSDVHVAVQQPKQGGRLSSGDALEDDDFGDSDGNCNDGSDDDVEVLPPPSLAGHQSKPKAEAKPQKKKGKKVVRF